MAKDKGTYLTQRTGEYLVAAELSRRGFIATTFAGNAPHFDILAFKQGKTAHIQVKTIKGFSWQLDARKFLNFIQISDEGQEIEGEKKSPCPGLVCVFVILNARGTDEFYVFGWEELQEIVRSGYKPRKPPQNIKSFHIAIWPKNLQPGFKENWELIDKTTSKHSP